MPATIETVLREFLDDQRERLSAKTHRRYKGGHRAPPPLPERLRLSVAFSAGRQTVAEGLRCRRRGGLLPPDGAEKIVENLGEFLGYFMIRKVMAG